MNTSNIATQQIASADESPELSVVWMNLFSAAWDCYDRLIERRRARAEAEANTATGSDNRTPDQTEQRP